MGERVKWREKESQMERQIDRQKYGKMDIQKDGQVDRWTDGQQIDRWKMESQKVKKRERKKERQKVKKRERKVGRQITLSNTNIMHQLSYVKGINCRYFQANKAY